MRRLNSLAMLLMLPVLVHGRRIPDFHDFPAIRRFSGRPAPAKIQTPRARMFGTMIKEGAKQQPNFAGHYTLVTWGCGSDCISFAVVDAKTGRVFFNRQVLAVTRHVFQEGERLQFRADSRLLIVEGDIDGTGGRYRQGKFFYELKDDQFYLIRALKMRWHH